MKYSSSTTMAKFVPLLLLLETTAFSPAVPSLSRPFLAAESSSKRRHNRHEGLFSAVDSSDNYVDTTSQSASLEHAREVFFSFDIDDSGTIGVDEVGEMLRALDIDASEEESTALFRYLDSEGSGEIGFDDFLPWYSETAEAAQQSASVFQDIILSRRTVDEFDRIEVDPAVLQRALECAIAAPNRRLTEPWRFIRLGPKTVEKLSKLKEERQNDMDGEKGGQRWTDIPGWIVVTYPRTPDNQQAQREDFKSVCCAVQNFMLSMWSEGIGSKWTDGPIQRTQEFADICGVDRDRERVAGVIWYGFAKGGLGVAKPKERTKDVDDVLDIMP